VAHSDRLLTDFLHDSLLKDNRICGSLRGSDITDTINELADVHDEKISMIPVTIIIRIVPFLRLLQSILKFAVFVDKEPRKLHGSALS
jgi:hypothetical protein